MIDAGASRPDERTLFVNADGNGIRAAILEASGNLAVKYKKWEPLEERVDAHDVSTLQVFDEKLIAHWDKVLIRAVAALPAALEEASWFPLVGARGSVACLAGLLESERRVM